jgi:hypothetical protein
MDATTETDRHMILTAGDRYALVHRAGDGVRWTWAAGNVGRPGAWAARVRRSWATRGGAERAARAALTAVAS